MFIFYLIHGGSVSRRLRTLKRKKEEKENSKNQVSSTFLLIFQCALLRIFTVLRIRDVYPGSRDVYPGSRDVYPGSRVKKTPDPGSRSASKNLSIFNPKIVSKLSKR
jgi:hypothetical protein